MLTTRQRYLAAITDRWGGLDLSSFAQRMLLQKRIFFTSMLGVNLGHTHSWYIRGPYSPSLTRDAYSIKEARNVGGKATVALPSSLARRLKAIEESFGALWNDAREMELLASVFYLARMHRTTDVEFLSKKLTSLKGHFSKNDAAKAVAWLTEKGLLDV